MKIYDALLDRLLDADHAALADKLLDMKKTRPLWEVIRYIFDTWKKSSPSVYESFIFEVKEKQRSRGTVYGSNSSKTLRYLVDIPKKIYMLIRILYPVEQLQMDKKFMREFARRFPECRVAQKI